VIAVDNSLYTVDHKLLVMLYQLHIFAGNIDKVKSFLHVRNKLDKRARNVERCQSYFSES